MAPARALSPLTAPPKKVADDPGILTCRYTGRGFAVAVTVDTLPQAGQRWARGQDELWQNTAGFVNRPADRPRPLKGIGVGAYWIPASGRLVATDEHRLVTVTVARRRGAAARRVARNAARATLRSR